MGWRERRVIMDAPFDRSRPTETYFNLDRPVASTYSRDVAGVPGSRKMPPNALPVG